MTAISYHDTVNDLQDLDWTCGGPFARLDWFGLLEQSGMHPLLATARAGNQAVALPLQFGDGQVEELSNWYAFTWSDIRTSGVTSDEMLEALVRDLATRTSRVSLSKLPAEDGTLDRMRDAFRKGGWLAFAEPCDINHVLSVEGRSFAKYLAERPGRLRTTLKRKATKVEVTLACDFEPQDWAAYEDIYAQSWKPEEGDPALLRRFAEAESAAGRYRFAIARYQGEPVAAQFWTVDNGTAYIHKLAHRVNAGKLSPGTTLTAALLERVIDIDKVELVDFGTGDDAYKRDWMEEVRTRWRLLCMRPSAPRNWPVMAKALLHKLVRRSGAG